MSLTWACATVITHVITKGRKQNTPVLFSIHRVGGRINVNAAGLIERGVWLDVIKSTSAVKAVFVLFIFCQKGQTAMDNVASFTVISIRFLK